MEKKIILNIELIMLIYFIFNNISIFYIKIAKTKNFKLKFKIDHPKNDNPAFKNSTLGCIKKKILLSYIMC